jgi:hypothetical protein
VSLRFPSRASAAAVGVLFAAHPVTPRLAAVSARSPRPALVDDGVMSFLAFLVLLLAISLFAVIRLPRWAGGPADEDAPAPAAAPARRVPAHAHTARPPGPAPTGQQPAGAQLIGPQSAVAQPAGPLPAGPQPGAGPALSFPAAAAGQYGGLDPAVGPAPRPMSAPGVAPPVVSGSPPWGPAPKPPDVP